MGSYNLDSIMCTEKFNLSWNEFEKCASNTFKDLLGEPNFVDVTLVSDDLQQIKAHKVILSSCSSVFKTILQNNPQQQPIIYMMGVTYKELQSMLNFMYLGQTEVDQDNLKHFMEVSAKFDVKGLSLDKHDEEPSPNSKFKIENDFEKSVKQEGQTDIQLFENSTNQTKLDSLETPDTWEYSNNTYLNQDKFRRPHPGNRILFCDQCDYKSELACNVKAHKKAKHEGVKFQCDQCDYKFSFSNALTRHKRNKHTN